MAKTQTLSFPIRLPDAMQADALRLLDASGQAINQILTELWPHLDLFAAERTGPAWKQVEQHLLHRSGHGSRQASDWAPWLCCRNPKCLWNGARDYAASLNIARLGMAFLLTYHQTKRYQAYRMTDPSVKPALYIRAGATLLLPSQGITPRPLEGKHIYYAGWSYSIALRTSRPKNLLAVLSTSQLRKYVLSSA